MKKYILVFSFIIVLIYYISHFINFMILPEITYFFFVFAMAIPPALLGYELCFMSGVTCVPDKIPVVIQWIGPIILFIILTLVIFFLSFILLKIVLFLKEKSKKTLGIIVIVLLLIGLGSYLYVNSKKIPYETETYINDEFNFRINYPDSWIVDDSGAYSTVVIFINSKEEKGFKNNISVIIRKLSDYNLSSLDEYVSLDEKMMNNTKTDLIIAYYDSDYDGDGIPDNIMSFMKYKQTEDLYLEGWKLMEEKDGLVYVVEGTYLDQSNYKKIIKEVVNSFRIIN